MRTPRAICAGRSFYSFGPASVPQASNCVSAGKGEGPSAWISSPSFSHYTVRGWMGKLWGCGVLTRDSVSALPSEKMTLALVQ